MMTRILFAALALGLILTSCETTDSTPGLVNAPSDGSAIDPSDPSGPKPYPRSDCLVTGEKLDSKNTPMTFVHKGQEIKVCCAACKIAFNMSPDTYLAKIQ